MLEVLRKEIKYIVPIEYFIKIENRLKGLMTYDKNGEYGKYYVRSQYFDSIDNRDYFDNLNGAFEKQKIRLRIYSPKAEHAKLEYKCKSNTDGKKMSLLVSRDEAKQMEAHKYDFLLSREEDLALYLYTKMTQYIYHPKTIVEYQRQAFSYPVSDLRITFDTRVRASVNPYGLFSDTLSAVPIMNEDLGVLEVKYNDFLPSIFKSIIKEINDVATANSKYSYARQIL